MDNLLLATHKLATGSNQYRKGAAHYMGSITEIPKEDSKEPTPPINSRKQGKYPKASYCV